MESILVVVAIAIVGYWYFNSNKKRKQDDLPTEDTPVITEQHYVGENKQGAIYETVVVPNAVAPDNITATYVVPEPAVTTPIPLVVAKKPAKAKAPAKDKAPAKAKAPSKPRAPRAPGAPKA